MTKNSKYLYFTTLKQWRLYIYELLSRNDLAVKKAIVAIYKNQTQDEREKLESRGKNKKGFNYNDGTYFSCLAIDIINGHDLSPQELEYARYRMKRYWRQLMNISKQNISQFLSEQEKQEIIKEDTKSLSEPILGPSEDKVEKDIQLNFLDILLEEDVYGKSIDN